jgi:hypothetical protein
MNAAAGGDSIVLRAAEPGDAARIAAIYAHHVLTGLATFEVEPPDEAEIERRLAAVRARGLPYLVAEAGGRVVGTTRRRIDRDRLTGIPSRTRCMWIKAVPGAASDAGCWSGWCPRPRRAATGR